MGGTNEEAKGLVLISSVICLYHVPLSLLIPSYKELDPADLTFYIMYKAFPQETVVLLRIV